MSVDLPEPEGPITAVSSPLATSTDTPRRACTVVSPVPYWRVRSRADTTWGGPGDALLCLKFGRSHGVLLVHGSLVDGHGSTLAHRRRPDIGRSP